MYGIWGYGLPYYAQPTWIILTPVPPIPPTPTPTPTPTARVSAKGSGQLPPALRGRPETREDFLRRQQELDQKETLTRQQLIDADDADVLEIIAAITKVL